MTVPGPSDGAPLVPVSRTEPRRNPPASSTAAVQHARDVGVVHQRQGLALGLEARHDLARVHARLEYLQRDHATDRLLLFGHEHQAETALADLLEQLVMAQDAAGSFTNRLGARRHNVLLEKIAGLALGLEQGVNLSAQDGIRPALLRQKTLALRRRGDRQRP